MKRFTLLFLTFLLVHLSLIGQNTEKKVILQGFWWDYQNANFNTSWANYLIELAPRLKDMGIDAVWIPPTYKNNSTASVGYSPFDHYDLGDKYQKGNVRTRVGTKDELLRLVAVLHANGIEVIQDVVLNHVTNAGTSSGAGGIDPEPNYSMQTAGGFKNFRYVCYETPAPDNGENATEYLDRRGRWPKNYTNFHPHSGWNVTSGNWESSFWGPDFSYGIDESGTGNGYGPSTNATYNPTQNYNYNRDQARDWIMWFKRQTDVDGFRWDAVKHFPHFVVQDLSYNLKYLNGFANGGVSMINFGEYVGGKTALDAWVNNVAFSNGGSDKLAGTFDFALRDGLKGITSSLGAYDMSQIPGTQQNERVTYYANENTYVHITLPFVNNHDTFRPIVDASGNYTGWDSANEIGGHIEPNDPRLSVVYAITFAVDGNPMVFFEDLFNIGYNGNRFSHDPTNPSSLPVQSDIENIIWCHQNLDFKSGPYKVRFHNGNAADHLIIERSGRAIIGANDNWNTWQTDWVDSDFPPGTVLQDYSGASTNTVTVQSDQRVQIATPPCNGTANNGRRGYSVWAPVGQGTSSYIPQRSASTTQQWEMNDDLGDSNCQSLQQGGRIPDNSTAYRNVGKIFVESGNPVNCKLIPTDPTKNLTLEITDLDDVLLFTSNGFDTLNTTYTPSQTGWLNIRIKNTTSQIGQICYVRATYTAPAVVNTSIYTTTPSQAVWTGAANTNWNDCKNWRSGFEPNATRDVLIPANSGIMPITDAIVFTKNLTIENGATLTVNGGFLNIKGNLTNNGVFTANCGNVRFNGDAQQIISGTGSTIFCNLKIRNSNHLKLLTDIEVTTLLDFEEGSLLLEDNNLRLGNNVTVATTDGYVITKDDPLNAGSVIRQVSSTEVLFPVGTADSYTPAFLTNTSGTADFSIRAFDNVYDNGGSGGIVNDLWNTVRQTWAISTDATNANATVKLSWNAPDEGTGFNRNNAAVVFNDGFSNWSGLPSSNTSGTNPYFISGTTTNINGFYTVSDNLTVNTTSVENPSVTFKIYPNPTSEQVTLIGENVADWNSVQVQMFTVTGTLVFESNGNLNHINQTLSQRLTRFADGVYLVQIQHNGQRYNLKFVKR